MTHRPLPAELRGPRSGVGRGVVIGLGLFSAVMMRLFSIRAWRENIWDQPKHLLFGAFAGFFINAGNYNWLFIVPVLLLFAFLRASPGLVTVLQLCLLGSVFFTLRNHWDLVGWLFIIPIWQVLSELAKTISLTSRSVREMEFLNHKLEDSRYRAALKEVDWPTFLQHLPDGIRDRLRRSEAFNRARLFGRAAHLGAESVPVRGFFHCRNHGSPPQSASHAIFSALLPSYIVLNKPLDEWHGLGLFEVLHEVSHIFGPGKWTRDVRFTGRLHIGIAYVIAFTLLPLLIWPQFRSGAWTASGSAIFVFVFLHGALSLRKRFSLMDSENHGAAESRASLDALAQFSDFEEARRVCSAIIALRREAALQRFLGENQAHAADAATFDFLCKQFGALWEDVMTRIGFHSRIGTWVETREAYWLNKTLALNKRLGGTSGFEQWTMIPTAGFHDLHAYALMLGWALLLHTPSAGTWWIFGLTALAVTVRSGLGQRRLLLSRLRLNRSLESVIPIG